MFSGPLCRLPCNKEDVIHTVHAHNNHNSWYISPQLCTFFFPGASAMSGAANVMCIFALPHFAPRRVRYFRFFFAFFASQRFHSCLAISLPSLLLLSSLSSWTVLSLFVQTVQTAALFKALTDARKSYPSSQTGSSEKEFGSRFCASTAEKKGR